MILDFKSKWQFIKAILFNPKKVETLIDDYNNEAILDIKEDFQRKLDFMVFNEFDKKLIHPNNKSKFFEFAQIPIVENENISIKVKTARKENINISALFNHKTELEDLKHELSIVLAKELIDRGFVQSTLDDISRHELRSAKNGHKANITYFINYIK